MFCLRESIWLIVLILCNITYCYAIDSGPDSIAQALSSMDLKNVEKKNESEMNDIISKLSSIKVKTDSTAMANEKKDDPKNTGLKLLDQNKTPENVTSLKSPPEEIDSTNDKNVKPENIKMTTDAGKEKISAEEKDSFNDKTLHEEVVRLERKIEVIDSELDALIKLQKLSYENNTITLELDKSKPLVNEKNDNSNSDYIKKFLKGKSVSEDPSGFGYMILKAGSGKITENSLLRLTVSEKTANGRVLSLARDVTLRYSANLPPIIYKSLQYIGFGGEVKAVALARYSYPMGDYPKGVTANSPLVYMIDVGKNK